MSKPVALITGGASGIGLALTKHLLAKGWKVAIADVNQKLGTQRAQELGPDVLFHHTDVSVYADQVSMFKAAFNWGGDRLDFFAANAGVADRQNMYQKTEDLDANGDPNPLDLTTMQVDLMAVFQGCWIYKHFARRNRPTLGGKIIITSSNGGLYASSMNPQYVVAKHALVCLARSIGEPFFKNEKITVNAICPSFIMTDLAPPSIREIYPGEHATPISTALKAFDMFLDDGKTTGKIAELSIKDVILRDQLPYVNDEARWQMVDAMEIWKKGYGDPTAPPT